MSPCPSRAYCEEACHIKLFPVAIKQQSICMAAGRSKHRIPHLAFICVFTYVCMQELEGGFSCHFLGVHLARGDRVSH